MPNHVFFLGNSILLAGIAISLANYPEIELLNIKDCSAESAAVLAAQAAPLVIYDLSFEIPYGFASMLRKIPGVILVGLDPNSEFAWVLSGSRTPLGRMQDLVEMIRSQNFPALPE